MNLDTVLDVVAAVCVISGALLSVAAGVALLRFPDLLSRLHAATKPQVLGLLLVLTGCAVRLRTGQDVTTLVLVAVFQLATAPVAAHMVCRAGHRHKQVRAELLVTDDLAADEAKRQSAAR
jgi:multicomponent Na+:H+ antiporter subunit G